MVRTLVFAAWLASSTASAGALRAAVDPSSVALGQPVSLTLTATGLALDTLDITPLLPQFEVFSRTLSRSTDSETLVLTLYPRVAGSLRIPPLQLENSHTPALQVSILDGSETVPRVSTHWVLEPARPWVNQPARLRLSVCDDDSMQWTRPSLPTASGRLTRALDESVGSDDVRNCTLHHYDWSVIATRSGTFTLESPLLNATRFGQRLRFPAPAFVYQVQPLPAWLPAHVPPVKPQIVQDALPPAWPLNRPLSWRFQVTGGYSAEGLKALLDLQLHESAALGFYPPMITPAVADETSSPSSPLTRYDVVLYAEPRQRGVVQLPGVRLPWYDPARGQMAAVSLRAGSVRIHDPRWTRFGWAVGSVGCGILLVAAFWQARRMACWRRARQRGLQRIAGAETVEALARAVRQFSVSDMPEAPSLGAWMQQMQRDARGCAVDPLVAQLEQQQFGHAAPDPQNMRLAFLKALKRVRPTSLQSCGHSIKRKQQA